MLYIFCHIIWRRCPTNITNHSYFGINFYLYLLDGSFLKSVSDSAQKIHNPSLPRNQTAFVYPEIPLCFLWRIFLAWIRLKNIYYLFFVWRFQENAICHAIIIFLNDIIIQNVFMIFKVDQYTYFVYFWSKKNKVIWKRFSPTSNMCTVFL